MAAEGEAETAADFNVAIAGTAPADGSLVHAVTVVQPVQAWTVIRGHSDFLTMQESLNLHVPGIPACPQVEASVNTSLDAIVSARNQLQQWLLSILLFPGVRESPVFTLFLTDNANIIPPRYENVPWTMFSSNGQVANPPPVEASAPPQVPAAAELGGEFTMDDMMMDDLFQGGEEGAHGHPAEFDDREEHHPSQRYQQTNEPVSAEDEMEFENMAREVEIIEDIGSLAQSLGASHLGRSLMLQDEESGVRNLQNGNNDQRHQDGLTVGQAVNGMAGGGIGNAMANALPGQGNRLNQALPDLPPRLDSFRMIRVIGRGSFGKVFLVKENTTDNVYALKVLKKDNIIKRNQVEHTKTERSVLGYVNHPFIVGMRMAFQSTTKLYFVLDYCAGGELFFHLGKLGTFPEDRARFYTAEIVLAISYAHSLGIIYRDLKPENVLLDAEGHIRLTDFGLSKEGINNSASGANSFCGTPEYLAPEILKRQGHGRAVDWWSLGALLFEMLTGLPPFYDRGRERLFERIKNEELEYPDSLSRNARGVLRGLLTKDPTRRLGSGPADAEDIKGHAFFGTIDWDKLMQGEISAPWRPQITGMTDTSQFDEEFTSMPMFSPQSMRREGFGLAAGGNNLFAGFTFQDRGFHLAAQTQAGN